MGQIDRLTVVLSLALIVAVFGWASSTFTLIQTTTGAVTTYVSPESQVTIQKYFSINASGNLSAGIDFGIIDTLPTANQNATLNWNDTSYPAENDGNETLYFLTVETDSNTPVDFCITATEFNTSGGVEIEIGNYTFSDSEWNNITYPGPIDELTMSTSSYVAGETGIAVGSSDYFRFWLDVPATQSTGTYNNTITILGTSTGVPCP